MRAAFSTTNARIAPVFDTAQCVTLIDAEPGRIVGRAEDTLPADVPVQRVIRLAELGVETLVCGAISWTLHDIVSASGIEVVPFITGGIDEVVHAWLEGTIRWAPLAMPGCRHRGRPVCASGVGSDRGWRPRQPLPRHGRKRRVRGNRSCDACECAVCGHREPRRHGVSCSQVRCPVCGAPMVGGS